MQLLNIVHDLLQTGCDGETAAVRNIAEKYVKISDAVLHTAHKITIAHRELIKVAQHGKIDSVCAFHASASCDFENCAVKAIIYFAAKERKKFVLFVSTLTH